MNTRERFQAIINGQAADRLPLLEWASWWNETIDRWHQEELPTTIIDRYELCEHFGLDLYVQDWLPSRSLECPKPAVHLGSIVTNEAEYEAIKPYLFPDPFASPKRVAFWEHWAKRQEKGEAVLWFTVDGFFWFSRTLLGVENHLFAFYDEPALLHRINQDLTDWITRTVKQLCEICEPDFMTFAEDMSYNNGPMISEALYTEFMHPYYEQTLPLLKQHNITSIIDSDGDITSPIKWFNQSGLNGALPLERQAGVDIATLRENNPDTIFIGHFDKMTMNQGEGAMRKEFERLLPTASKGKFLISCDHQTPPGVSYKEYLLYLKLFREYAEKAFMPCNA